ncbi:MAG TPA: hypothetical protein VHT75_17735 [Acidimicrobiales bacterium]|jgi:hypothetical protein|nr:hypothetical protein [Acidimicrobiales bacterium]
MLYSYLNARVGVTGRDERGSLTLEQVIITAVLSAAAIAAGAAIVAAISSHQSNIK